MGYQNTITKLNENETEIELVNRFANRKLGFSIAGGIDNQHFRGDDGIYVKSIQDGGLVSRDGRIWVGDQIVAVKSGLDGERINLMGCTHDEVVALLRKVCSGIRVVLILKKCNVTFIKWHENEPLKFSISGGINKEHIPGDGRIYITRVFEGCNDSCDGHLSIGDRILGVKQNIKSKGMRSKDFFLMNKCTYKDAVSALQEAMKEKKLVLMTCRRNDIHHRLRFDDKEMMRSKLIGFENNSSLFFVQNFSNYRQEIPWQHDNKISTPIAIKTIKSILKPKNPSNSCDVADDEGLGESLSKRGESLDLPLLVQTNKKRNWDESSCSLISSVDENDSVLSSMSSEDEYDQLHTMPLPMPLITHFENTLFEDKKSYFGHQRQRSKHFIEPVLFCK